MAITVAARFNGPPNSGNGGYTCGMIAKAIGESVRVRLLLPPPLEQPLEVRQIDATTWQALAGTEVIAEATKTLIDIEAPPPPAYIEALGVSTHYFGFHAHPFPTCFVCGPERARGDGLRIFAASVPGTGIVAAPWMPSRSLAQDGGKVGAEFIWAALDCPGYAAAVTSRGKAVLGELAVHIDRSVHVDEPCVVVGWPIEKPRSNERVHYAGTALYDEDGERCAVGLATWIELKG